MAAVEAYRKVTDEFPYIENARDLDYNPNGTAACQKDPDEHMRRLLEVLKGKYDPAVANNTSIQAMLGDTVDGIDAYGNSMIFLSDKGVGGNPVIISAGPDGVFGFELDYADDKYKEDNIRSDTSN